MTTEDYFSLPELPDAVVSMQAADAEQQVVDTLSKWGFLAVTDHGVPEELIHNVTNTWQQDFFEQSPFFKEAMAADPRTEIGYVGKSGSSLGTVMDTKEFFVVKPNHPSWDARRHLPAPHFADTTDLLARLQEVGLTLMDWLEALGPAYPYLKDLCAKAQGSENTIMRVNYFPAPHKDNHPNAVPAKEHRDLGVLTVLVPSEQPGLVAWDRAGNCYRVPHRKNCLIINAGEILSILSGGQFNLKSGQVSLPVAHRNYPGTLHGVAKVPRTQARMSIPVFIHMDYDVIASEEDVLLPLSERGKTSTDVRKAIKMIRASGGLTPEVVRFIRLRKHGYNYKGEM